MYLLTEVYDGVDHYTLAVAKTADKLAIWLDQFNHDANRTTHVKSRYRLPEGLDWVEHRPDCWRSATDKEFSYEIRPVEVV